MTRTGLLVYKLLVKFFLFEEVTQFTVDSCSIERLSAVIKPIVGEDIKSYLGKLVSHTNQQRSLFGWRNRIYLIQNGSCPI